MSSEPPNDSYGTIEGMLEFVGSLGDDEMLIPIFFFAFLLLMLFFAAKSVFGVLRRL